MSSGIIYYNKGSKCLIRLTVSIFSLRRSGYAGDIAVIHEGDLPAWFIDENKTRGVRFVAIPADQHVDWALVQKPSLWRYTPFRVNLYIDSDTLVLRNPAELFPIIEDAGFAVTQFCDWTTDGGRIIRGRIESWRNVAGDELVDKAIAFGPAVNTGVFGFVQGHAMLSVWESLTRHGHAAGEQRGPASRIIDETACQVLIPGFPHRILPHAWNRSIKHTKLPENRTGIVHYHGGKHVVEHDLCHLWRSAYWDLRNTSRHYDALGDPQGDRRLAQFELPRQREDLTICCAADANYAGKLLNHFRGWMKTPGLREQRFIVFALGEADLPGLSAYSNVRVIPYKSSKAASPREQAFEAFILGVARHVKTPYWMKLDGDAHMTGPEFLWPDYDQATITADSWHYTKVKGDPHASRHWLNTLDDWWAGQGDLTADRAAPLFPIIEGPRHKHRRLRSYCWIEKTSYTRALAKRCGRRLPVPSHDTTSWYVATRLGETLREHAFREYIVA